MPRRILTAEERAACMLIYKTIQMLGIKIGNPADGGHWWNYDTYNDVDSDGDKYQTEKNPFIMGGPEDEKRYICRKWESIALALYSGGYPCDLLHCIRYYVLAEIQDDWKDEGEIAGEVVRNLEFNPDCV